MSKGQGLKYETVGEFQDVVDDYFVTADNNEKPYTVPSLAYHLEILPDTLMNYGARERYGDVVLRALCRIEAWTSEAVYDKNMSNGAKFNMGTYLGRIDKAAVAMANRGNQSLLLDQLAEKHAELLARIPHLNTQPNLATQPAAIIDIETNVDEAMDETIFDGEEGQDEIHM